MKKLILLAALFCLPVLAFSQYSKETPKISDDFTGVYVKMGLTTAYPTIPLETQNFTILKGFSISLGQEFVQGISMELNVNAHFAKSLDGGHGVEMWGIEPTLLWKSQSKGFLNFYAGIGVKHRHMEVKHESNNSAYPVRDVFQNSLGWGVQAGVLLGYTKNGTFQETDLYLEVSYDNAPPTGSVNYSDLSQFKFTFGIYLQ